MQTLGQILVLTVVNGALYGLLALGVVLVYRGSRVLNLALGEIATAAVFLAFELTAGGVPVLLSYLVAVAFAVGIGIAFERLVVRRLGDAPPVTTAVATIGLFLLLLTVELTLYAGSAHQLPALVPGSGFSLFGYVVNPSQVTAVLVVIVLAAGLTVVLRRTDFGLAVLASADDPQAVRLVGVPLSRVNAFTWGAGAGLAAVAGLLITPALGGTIAPGEISGRGFLFALAAALVGGLSSLQGAFTGGLVIALLEALAKQADVGSFRGLDTDVVVLVIIVTLVLRPQGLLSRSAR